MTDAPDIKAEFRLKPERPAVTRLSRKVLIGLAGVSTLAVLGTVIWALDGNQKRDEAPKELYTTDNRPTPDSLNQLPADYTALPPPEVPQLGPPLPGDLGGPILSAQERGVAVTVPTIQTQGIDREEQARLAEIEAARLSRLFVSTNTRETQTVEQVALPVTGLGVLSGLQEQPLPADPNAVQNTQERKLAFLNAAGDKRAVSAEQLMDPASPFLLQAGSIIPAALITGIRSDLPGQITAQVTSPVYDSPTGNYLLIPQGARLIGRYDSEVAFGQSRVLLVWDRLILPNGKSIILDNQPGTDLSGFAGLEDEVDYHWDRIFQAALLSTLLGASAEFGSSNDESDLLAALRGSGQDSIKKTGQQLVQNQIDVQPTLTIRPGFPVRILVNRDLILEPYDE